ncbi:calmodulin-A-like [Folsomia candida]|uniref:calmodulin-A-like n=1 Tax=Folsomia candida TaxID=158441 RepID=UPI001604B52F|nr:calmodulin-A-like [Folsomia candida]
MANSSQNLSDEQIAEFKESFGIFDKNGDGTISTKELGMVMRSMGKFPSAAELEQMINEVDGDGSGTIDFQEFLSMMKHNQGSRDEKMEVHESFRAIDKNGDGFITVGELRQVMANIGENASYEEIQEMVKVADLDGNGKVNFDEYFAVLGSK